MTDVAHEAFEQAVFDYLKQHLTVDAWDAGVPNTCGGDVSGNLGIRIRLSLTNPQTGKREPITETRCDLY
jgi:hypothetical protein